MITLTPQHIKALAYPGMPADKVATWASKMGAACQKYSINTPRRLAHFFAQVTHESMGLYYVEEVWGPTPAQIGYEGRPDLGNTQPGDGYRYRGRGPIEVTGRVNYHVIGKRIGYDLENHPDQAAEIGVGSIIACDFWTTRFVSLNKIADSGGLEVVPAITRVVNGGLNGVDDRKRRYVQAARVFGTT
jgi:putative chitinase